MSNRAIVHQEYRQVGGIIQAMGIYTTTEMGTRCSQMPAGVVALTSSGRVSEAVSNILEETAFEIFYQAEQCCMEP